MKTVKMPVKIANINKEIKLEYNKELKAFLTCCLKSLFYKYNF